jgi:hypothetical protein
VQEETTTNNREKVLILCRAVPEESTKYFRVVCAAGVNTDGELRRIYPVPFKPFVFGGGIPFHKKEWIVANLYPPDDKRDKRPESKRIDMNSIKVLAKADDDEVRKLIRRNLSVNIASIESSGASLGFIKPKILDYECEVISTEVRDEQSEVTLDGFGPVNMIKLKQESVYHFECQMRQDCSCQNQPHRMGIHDWEANELYRNVVGRDKDPKVIQAKMRLKWFDFMKTRDLYFMMGTHHRWKNWLVVSVLYLRPK